MFIGDCFFQGSFHCKLTLIHNLDLFLDSTEIEILLRIIVVIDMYWLFFVGNKISCPFSLFLEISLVFLWQVGWQF